MKTTKTALISVFLNTWANLTAGVVQQVNAKKPAYICP